MISISDSASSKVKELLEEQGKTDHALRVFVRGMSCSGPAYGMALDNEPRPEDQVAELDGVKVLIDPASAPYLEGAQVDYVDSLMGKGFTVVNPNVVESAGGCGCGNAAPAAHGCGCGSGGCGCGAR